MKYYFYIFLVNNLFYLINLVHKQRIKRQASLTIIKIMKIEHAHIEQIRTAFKNMQSREDFLHLLNEAKSLVYGEKAVPFQLKQLTWYSNPKLAKKRYTDFKIKKKSGAERIIHAPIRGLKSIQKTLSFVLQCVYEPHYAATGFVRDRSIVDNAKIHAGSKYVYNIDLKDFFPSIDQARVWKCLQLKPFDLKNTTEKADIKIKENSSLSTLVFPNSDPNRNITDIIIKLKYDGYHFKVGSWDFRGEKSGNISYEIEKYSNSDLSGIITIFKQYSSFEKTKENALRLAEEKKLDFDLVMKHMLFNIIVLHQSKIYNNDTRSHLANIIASLCCTEMEVERKNETGEWISQTCKVLPQGAPTSPVLSNIICQRLDYLLSAVANRFGLKYSRYADDMTFSSMHNVYQKDSEFIKELYRIIAEQGFYIKESKTRLQKVGYRQEVTGLLVNENVNVQKRYIKQLRMWLYYWENYGYERAYKFFIQQYVSDKGNTIKGKPEMSNVIDGKLNYLKMVRGSNNALYLKLKSRFDKLTLKQSFISKVLDVWEENGIDSAMNLYYSKNGEQSYSNANVDIELTPFDIHQFFDKSINIKSSQYEL